LLLVVLEYTVLNKNNLTGTILSVIFLDKIILQYHMGTNNIILYVIYEPINTIADDVSFNLIFFPYYLQT